MTRSSLILKTAAFCSGHFLKVIFWLSNVLRVHDGFFAEPMSSIVSLLETHTIFCWVSPFWLVGSTYLIQQCLACMYVCTKHTSSTSYVTLLNVCSSLQQRNRTRLAALYLGSMSSMSGCHSLLVAS